MVPATGMAARAPRMPAIFAPISTETRIASGVKAGGHEYKFFAH